MTEIIPDCNVGLTNLQPTDSFEHFAFNKKVYLTQKTNTIQARYHGECWECTSFVQMRKQTTTNFKLKPRKITHLAQVRSLMWYKLFIIITETHQFQT